ncbi:MAG TPA: hypothetical protein VGC98_05680, partial [Thermoleophilaceae bacterium]
MEVLASSLEGVPHAVAVRAARHAIAAARERLAAGGEVGDLSADAASRARPSLRRVLNATGVIVHTNLGRAPLPEAALEAIAEVAAGYST